MTLLAIDGFEAQDASLGKWTQYLVGTSSTLPVTYPTTTRFSYGNAVQPPHAQGNPVGALCLQRSFTASSQVFVGAAIQHGRVSGNAYSPAFHILVGDSGVTGHLFLTVTQTGALQLYRGDGRTIGFQNTYSPTGALLAATSGGVVDANWHYIEMSATIDPSAGSVVVRLDGSTVITFTGNTKNGGTNNSIDGVVYAGFGSSGAIVDFGATTVDDFYVCNSSGSVNNGFAGDVRIQTLMPNAAGTTTQLTPNPNTNANWQNVSDIPNSTSTYNTSSTVGQRDTYRLQTLLTGTASVKGVQQTTAAFKSDSGSGNLKAAQRSVSTVSYGATKSPGTSNTVWTDIFETNPATSTTWAVSDVNALECGAEVA